LEKARETDHSKDLEADGIIIFKWILKDSFECRLDLSSSISGQGACCCEQDNENWVQSVSQ
jgi:hypothetical protein